MESEGLTPSPDADPQTLIRRLSFDLTGLPPSPEISQSFLDNPSTENYARIVDILLSSPAFGERWARHWLDLARFAESSGKDRNYAFPEAWRYRDWVIRSFNADIPFDDFIRLQIAGDLLPSTSDAQADDQLIATAFLALGPKSLNEPRRPQFLIDQVDEQIDVTTRAILGLSIACARCHDHKSDPFTQRDYYALAGIFDSTDTYYGTAAEQGNRHPSGHLPLKVSRQESLKSVSSPNPAPAAADPQSTAPEPASKNQLTNSNPSSKTKPRPRRNERPLLPPGPPPGTPRTMGLKEGAPHNHPLLVRGEISQRGPLIPRAVPRLNPSLLPSPPAVPSSESGRRQLAEWLASPSNPLTARVHVNRIWQHLFGKGLVRTPDDFGTNGQRPSHPELLDFLALQFMSDGWSSKRLIRALVLTHAYQLSDRTDPQLLDRDPDNILLARHSIRRVEAEVLRDSMLYVSGVLDTTPPHSSPIASLGDGRVGRNARLDRSDPVLRKRSIYLPLVRGFVPEVLELFDFAEPSLIIAEREITNVPAQSLHLMNSEPVTLAARAFARRLLRSESSSPRDKIQLAYHLAFNRAPTKIETERALDFMREELPASTKPNSREPLGLRPREKVWTNFAQALLASAEFRFVR